MFLRVQKTMLMMKVCRKKCCVCDLYQDKKFVDYLRDKSVCYIFVNYLKFSPESE